MLTTQRQGTEDGQDLGGGGVRDARSPTWTEHSTSGSRPGVLNEPAPPLGEAVTDGYVATGVPLLAPLGLGVADNSLDATALSFLLAQNLVAQEKKKEEEREKVKHEKAWLEKQG